MFYFEIKNYLYRPVSEASGFLIVMVKVPFDPTIEYFSPSSQTWQKSECSGRKKMSRKGLLTTSWNDHFTFLSLTVSFAVKETWR